MPVKIETFAPLSEDEFQTLRQKKLGAKNPAMDALLDEIATGQPMRVALAEGQSARGLRVAISRAATGRGLRVETLEGNGFVAVRRAGEPHRRKARQAPASDVHHRRAPGA
jgi:hypothetical protein